MSGVFKVPFAYTGNGNVDLAQVVAGSGKPLVFLGYNIAQLSDFGDAQEENLPITFKTGATSSGSGGSAVTPNPVDTSNAAATFTAQQANTTKASGGTITPRYTDGWNVRVPDKVRLTQEEQVLMTAGLRGTLEIGAAADSLTIVGEAIFQEIG